MNRSMTYVTGTFILLVIGSNAWGDDSQSLTFPPLKNAQAAEHSPGRPPPDDSDGSASMRQTSENNSRTDANAMSDKARPEIQKEQAAAAAAKKQEAGQASPGVSDTKKD